MTNSANRVRRGPIIPRRLFDPIIEEWLHVGDMRHGRWYPSLVTLGDGRAIAVSGIAEPSEIYSPMSGWSLLPRGTDLPLYPHLLLLANGRVFFTGGQIGQAAIDARMIDPLSAAETIVPGLRDQGNRDQGPSVLAEVSMLLGHSELRVTMDFYAHLQKQTAAKAARQMDAILG